MSDNAPEKGIEQLFQPKETIHSDSKVSVSPLTAAGIGVVAIVFGAGIVVLWPATSDAQPQAPVSVRSCSDQYTTIAGSLNLLVSEGIQAGQAPTPDVSWINSIHERQDELQAQLEALAVDCADAER